MLLTEKRNAPKWKKTKRLLVKNETMLSDSRERFVCAWQKDFLVNNKQKSSESWIVSQWTTKHFLVNRYKAEAPVEKSELFTEHLSDAVSPLLDFQKVASSKF